MSEPIEQPPSPDLYRDLLALRDLMADVPYQPIQRIVHPNDPILDAYRELS